jgi:A/G-specific adenine glycosylase
MPRINKKQRDFIELVWRHYAQHGRVLPWRNNHRAYRVLVSELMLQQTQVERVKPKFQNFIKQFPSCKALAAAPLADVLTAWQGLGYNRRARFLHETARILKSDYAGRIPRDEATLVALPGIGVYTARAILVFSYNIPTVLIETNIRSVFLHHFFEDASNVHDRDILPLIDQTLDTAQPRIWYWALMDYGAALKSSGINPSRASVHHTKQKPFRGSDRELRGALLRAILLHQRSFDELLSIATATNKDVTVARTRSLLRDLSRDGLITKHDDRFAAPLAT